MLLRCYVILILLASCSFSGPLREDKSAENYVFPNPPVGWRALPAREGAERLYEHKSSRALLSVSSLCERYQETNLERLAQAALTPIDGYREIESNRFMLDGREAFQVLGEGKLDGVTVQIDFVAWRKGTCLFDFSLQGAGKLSPQARADFMKMLEGFRYRP